MKNGIIFLILIFCFQSYGQRKPKIKGNRSVIEVNEMLPFFNAITLNEDLDIVLKKSNSEGYTITADDNLIDVLKFKVKDSTLFISAFYKITAKKKLDIVINYVDINKITVQHGKISMKDIIAADELSINTFGASRLELNATASFIKINMEGMSSGDFNIASDSLHITIKDRVDARVYTVGDVSTLNAYNNASATIEGTSNRFLVNLFGYAKLKGEVFEVTNIHAVLEESTNAKLQVIENLELSASGSSKTQVYGTGKITLLEFLDSAQLLKKK